MNDCPLLLQMEIDLSVAAHKREIAEGFAKLREELLPPIRPVPYLQRMRDLQQLYYLSIPGGWLDPYNGATAYPLQAANAAWANNRGMCAPLGAWPNSTGIMF